MKIGLRGGHSPNCKGACGILDEQAEVRKVYNEMVPLLQAAGHTVINCNSDASTVNRELSEGTNKTNSNRCDIYVTIHMNASGGAGNGTEVWMYDGNNSNMNSIAGRICQNFASKGFQNRGVKYNTGFHDLSASAMPAMIVETFFCDNQRDVDLYRKIDVRGTAELIVNGITGKNISTASSTISSSAKTLPSQVPGKTEYNENRVNYRVHQQSVGTLPVVKDGQTSGIPGGNLRIESLRVDIKVPDFKCKVMGHIQGIGDVDYGQLTKDTVIGSEGKFTRLEGFRFYDIESDKWEIYARVEIQDMGWSNWIKSGSYVGTTGYARRIEALQVKLLPKK